MNTTIFAQRLKEARTAAKLTQAELCKISGVTAATISAYESADGNKGKNPSLDNALKLAQALNVSLDWLCGSLVNSNKVQISDFLKMLVKLSESIDISVDSIDLANDNLKKIVPNATNQVIDEDFYCDYKIDCMNMGEKFEYPVSFVAFGNIILDNFLCEWVKMKDLYKKNTIDESLYNLWLDKQYKDIDETQRKNEQAKIDFENEINAYANNNDIAQGGENNGNNP